MLVIGIAGGIACGKSSVAREFQRLGAEILDADRVGHEVLQEPEVMNQIRNQWGDQVLSSGKVDRKALASIVFSKNGKDDLRRLEEITHPRIESLLKAEISRLKSKQDIPAVVLDAPVMFKAGWNKLCDKIVFVDVPLEIRQNRAAATRDWTSEELRDRELNQTPLAEKKDKSSDIIDNSGTPKQLAEQVHQLWLRWGLESFVRAGNLPEHP